MDIRICTEENEKKILSKFACLSKNSKGRNVYEPLCSVRTCFQRDRDRIIHSKAFRRLMHKTQVFISPEDDHYRTRLTHTLEVSQISRTISMALGLNESLTEAIALGHDLGHTPFGHLGEQVLNNLRNEGFEHNEQSVRVVEMIEREGRGLNLSKEVIDGILNHRGAGSPETLEGKVVQISDKIAYVNHDIDDAVRARIITEEMLPRECVKILGTTKSERINTLIIDIIENSMNKNDIIMSSYVKQVLYKLRAFLFKNVYRADEIKDVNEKCGKYIQSLYGYFIKDFAKMPKEFVEFYTEEDINDAKETIICDYIAGMTDRFATKLYMQIF